MHIHMDAYINASALSQAMVVINDKEIHTHASLLYTSYSKQELTIKRERDEEQERER